MTSLLPEVAEWLGFECTELNPKIADFIYAITANDEEEWNFDSIADAFEETFLKMNDKSQP